MTLPIACLSVWAIKLPVALSISFVKHKMNLDIQLLSFHTVERKLKVVLLFGFASRTFSNTAELRSPTDVFGNLSLPFTPTVAQIAYELTSGGAPEPTVTDYSTCLFEIARTGTVVQEYAIANGTAVTETSVNAATPLITLKDIDWGFKGNT